MSNPPAAAETPSAPDAGGFLRLGPADLAPGTMRGIQAGAISVLLVNIGGTYYALDDACGHAGYPISKGTLDGPVATCILHGAEFDVRTGDHLSDPPLCGPQRSFPVEIRDGAVYIKIQEGS